MNSSDPGDSGIFFETPKTQTAQSNPSNACDSNADTAVGTFFRGITFDEIMQFAAAENNGAEIDPVDLGQFVSVSCRQSGRATMQDRAVCQQVNLHNGSWQDALEKFTADLTNDTAAMEPGSTVLAVGITKQKKIFGSYMGDSEFVLFFEDASNGRIVLQRLTRPHVASDPVEQKLIRDAGNGKYLDQIAGNWVVLRKDSHKGAMVSRSIGDCNYPGMIRDAETFVFDPSEYTNKPENKNLRLLGAAAFTDGAFIDSDSIDWLRQEIEFWRECKKPGVTLASFISACAVCFRKRDGFTPDNVSVAVIDLSNSIQNDLAIGMFDGHGGDEHGHKTAEFGAGEMQKLIASIRDGSRGGAANTLPLSPAQLRDEGRNPR